MSFWDNVKKFAQPYSDDEYDEYDEEEMEDFEDEAEETPSRSGRRTPNFSAASEDNSFDFGSSISSSTSSGFSGQVLNMSSGKQ